LFVLHISYLILKITPPSSYKVWSVCTKQSTQKQSFKCFFTWINFLFEHKKKHKTKTEKSVFNLILWQFLFERWLSRIFSQFCLFVHFLRAHTYTHTHTHTRFDAYIIQAQTNKRVNGKNLFKKYYLFFLNIPSNCETTFESLTPQSQHTLRAIYKILWYFPIIHTCNLRIRLLFDTFLYKLNYLFYFGCYSCWVKGMNSRELIENEYISAKQCYSNCH
jgi:hypothetical protein